MATIPSSQKILTSAPEVNTNYGGPASLQALNTWYTMEDISNTVKPYKVYTALLTQSGGDNTVTINFDDDPREALVIGITYTITSNEGGLDMTNIGAPNNEFGTKFVATGTTPTSWGMGSLEYNTGAPVVTVLENAIGNIWWIYDGDGYSIGTSSGLFTNGKTWMVINGNADGVDDFRYVMFDAFDNNQLNINTFRINSSGVKTPSSNMLDRTPIEIRVYN